MNSRISPDRLHTRKIHHEAVMYLLRLCADLIRLNDAGQPLRADTSRLEEWATHRADLGKCEESMVRYTQREYAHVGEILKHFDLLALAGDIIGELKLRNAGEGMLPIEIEAVEELRRMAIQINCRKRTVFY